MCNEDALGGHPAEGSARGRSALTGLCLIVTIGVGSCGARTAPIVEAPDAGERDAGAVLDAPPMDAPRADAGSDAPTPLVCPPPSDFGYAFRAGGSIPVGGRSYGVSMAGDGSLVQLTYDTRDTLVRTTHLYAVDGLAYGTSQRTAISTGGPSRVAAAAGAFHILWLSNDETIGYLRWRAIRLPGGGVSVPRRRVTHIARPVWTGDELLIVAETGPEVWVHPFVDGAAGSPWLNFGPGSEVEAAADPADGVVRVLVRGGDGMFRIHTLRDGGVVGEPISLEPIGLVGRAAFGLVEEGGDQPYVLAGFSEEDGRRVTVRRFREDGRAAGGFSASFAEGTAVDLSTAPPRGHRSGYGVAVADPSGALFHGAGQDFVGDARPLPIACDGQSVSVAPGPCGYVIACTNGPSISLALAIPPAPR